MAEVQLTTPPTKSLRERSTPRPAQIQFPPASGRAATALAQNEVHVWIAHLDLNPAIRTRLLAILTDAERQRAASFRFDLHRNRFSVGRSLLRHLLGRYLQTDPAALQFVYGAHGKPALAAAFESAGVHFNLAHSEDLAIFAFSQIAPVGVDLELIRAMDDVEQLAVQFFSARESRLFLQLDPADRPQAFFNLWTRKEAFLKATGEGIAASLKRVEVSFLPGEPPRILCVHGDSRETDRWSLHDVSPARNWCASLALRAPPPRVRCWKWDGWPA